jgi:hypothetical protein
MKDRSVTVRFPLQVFTDLAALKFGDHRAWWKTSDHIREAVKRYVQLSREAAPPSSPAKGKTSRSRRKTK